MTSVRSILSSIALDKQQCLQQIRDDAEKKYKKQFNELIHDIDDLIKYEIDFDILKYLNDKFPALIKKLEELFEKCKRVCKKYAPEQTKEQFAGLERTSKYAYAQTCKSIKVIDACVKFNTLFSLFEIRLNMLNNKIKIMDRSRRRTVRSHPIIKSSKSRSTRDDSKSSRTRSNPSIDVFYRNFADFSTLMKSEM
jgi:DNA-binding protein H-NS